MFHQRVKLEVLMTTSSGGVETVSRVIMYNTPLAAFYEVLKPGGVAPDWPDPLGTMALNPVREISTGDGVVSWEVNIHPCHIPGVLKVAWIAPTEGDPVIDHIDSYNLGAGDLSTGELAIGTYDITADPPESQPWTGIQLRFYPSYLAALAV